MNDNDKPHRPPQHPMPLDERELPEWLQRESDAIREEEARDRFWLGLITLVVIFAFLIAANAVLGAQGYGA